ncbi:MAG: helix-turn-helix transcriptional regulator [Ruminococcaceae bacterium]|nr:helix-turn-helix transcriptional regulator [Oscillospiraceae bacterium]
MKYYQRLRDLREDHNLLQKDVALLLQTTQPQYTRYETGERELPMHHFITLAKYYNVSLDYLAGLTDTPKTLDGTPYRINKKI